jgi:hypothetical protein
VQKIRRAHDKASFWLSSLLDRLFICKVREKVIQIAEEVTPEDTPELEMPGYDERGMDDPLTTANWSKVFVE